MAAQDPTYAKSHDASGPTAVDGPAQRDLLDDGGIPDPTVIDDNTSSIVEKQGKSPHDIFRIEYASLKNKDANGTISVHFSGTHNYVTMALLAYDTVDTPETTEKLSYTMSGGSPAVFTLPQSFLDKLHDLGSGKGAVRIVEDLEIDGDTGVTEIDADFTEAGVASKPYYFRKMATG